MKGLVGDRRRPQSARQTIDLGNGFSAEAVLEDLLNSSLIVDEDWEALAAATREVIRRCADPDGLLDLLLEHGLLNEYQTERVRAGTGFGLVLGNYRVLDRLGAGGMGVVFKGEHVLMRRQVAIKVLPWSPEENAQRLARFLSEMRAVARLKHPNIVAAFDAGTTAGVEPGAPVLHYFVMEYVPGQDLEQYVESRGPLCSARACNLIDQVAGALAEAHAHHLVHRDIKPSNVLVIQESQAKLLDFGLARHFGPSALTQPGVPLGTVDYMAPEQVQDASAVDIRADIYGLGGTLFWCLTGRVPFEAEGSLTQKLVSRTTQAPPSVRTWRPEIPAELDALVGRMMAVNRDDRYATPQAVRRALLPFQQLSGGDSPVAGIGRAGAGEGRVVSLEADGRSRMRHILIADDEADNRMLCRFALQAQGLQCGEAADGAQALQAASAGQYDLVLLDIDMPELPGPQVLRRLRADPPAPHLKIVMVSGRVAADEMAQMLAEGADDYLAKPLSVVQLQARVKAALDLKEAQDRADGLNGQLLGLIGELETTLSARDSEVLHVRNALVLALAKLVEQRNAETGAHLLRLQRYSRCLAEEAAGLAAFAGRIDPNFVRVLESGVPLHDIGYVALPDHILRKPGKLDADERLIMQSHTVIGADTLKAVAQRHGPALGFLHMAISIARHHHERFDGAGYPDRLAGDDIPLAARIVTIGDVYDALRSRRAYRPAFAHASAVQLMSGSSAEQFDPLLLQTFQRCAPRFERIFRELPDWMDC